MSYEDYMRQFQADESYEDYGRNYEPPIGPNLTTESQIAAEAAGTNVPITQPEDSTLPVELPSWKSLAWQWVPFEETDDTRRKADLWESNRDVPLEELPIHARDKDKLNKLRFDYGVDKLRNWVGEAKEYDANIRREQVGAGVRNLFNSFLGNENYSHPIEEPEAPEQPAGTWDPRIHAGMTAEMVTSGVRQLTDWVPGIDAEAAKKYSDEVQDRLETYEQYDHPLAAQLTSDMIYMLPTAGASPLVIGGAEKLIGAGLAKAGAKRAGARMAGTPLAKQIGREKAIRLPPGVGGAAGGASVGATLHVDPDVEEPWRVRLSRAGVGGVGGMALDQAATLVGRGANMAKTMKAREEVSKGLPVPVKMPGAPLWNQRDAAITARNYMEKEMSPTMDIPQRTKQLYEEGYGRAAEDIKANADIIRKNITGKAEPQVKGAPLETILSRLPKKYAADEKVTFEAIDNFIDTKPRVILKKDVINDITANINKDINRQFRGIPVPRKIQSIQKLAKKIRSRTKKSAGLTNANDILKLERTANTLVRGSDTLTERFAAKTQRDIIDHMKTLKENGMIEPASLPNDVRAMDNAVNATTRFYEKYGNPVIKKAAKGEVTPREFSDSLFGNVHSAHDTVTRLDAISKLSTNPARQKALRAELGNRMLQGNADDSFDLPDFVSTYGKTAKQGEADKLLQTLTTEQRDQLENLYRVSKQLDETYKKKNVEGLARGGLLTQAFSKEMLGTGFSPLNFPIIKQLGGENVLKLLQARRYVEGFRDPMGNVRNAGKTGALEALGMYDPQEQVKFSEEQRRKREEEKKKRLLDVRFKY